MPTSSDSIQDIKETCASEGVHIQSIEQVRKDVFKSVLSSPIFDDSSTVYIRVYSEEREDDLRSFVPVASDSGHPECTLVSGETVCLLMDVASGRPLSQLLPVVFFPGLWHLTRQQYRQVYRQVGTQLGTLHRNTVGESGPVLEERDQKQGVALTRLLDGNISDTKVKTVQTLLEQATEYKSPYVLTFGDRSPHNIYYDGSRVWQIDNMCKRKSVVYEHVSVMMGIRLMVKRLPYASSSIIPDLEEAYWDGYQATWERAKPDEKALAVRYIYKNLRLLEHYDSGVSSLNSKLTRWMDPPIIYDEIVQTLESYFS